jgi:large subunit ribosomal protein L45
MFDPMKFKTVRWTWVESLEEPQVVNMHTREMLSKEDLFAQVTVRFHSKQVDQKNSIIFKSQA